MFCFQMSHYIFIHAYFSYRAIFSMHFIGTICFSHFVSSSAKHEELKITYDLVFMIISGVAPFLLFCTGFAIASIQLFVPKSIRQFIDKYNSLYIVLRHLNILQGYTSSAAESLAQLEQLNKQTNKVPCKGDLLNEAAGLTT